jgi:hypothetical protein
MTNGQDDNVIYLSQEEWDWLQARLTEEPKVLPQLRKLLRQPTIFEQTKYVIEAVCKYGCAAHEAGEWRLSKPALPLGISKEDAQIELETRQSLYSESQFRLRGEE